MKNSDFVNTVASWCDKEADSASLSQFSDKVMNLFLQFASETEDNLDCFNHIEYGIVSDRDFGPESVFGLKVKGKNILVSDVISGMGIRDIPKMISDDYPELTKEEWLAIRRITSIVLISLECSKKEK